MTNQHSMPRLSLRHLIWMCLGTITLIFVVPTAFSAFGRVEVARALDELDRRVQPAQQQVAALANAYVDQETAQRGFMLTGNRSLLEPYFAGRSEADRLVAELHAGLAGDAEAGRRLDAVVAAAKDWSTQAADPQIDARRSQSIPPDRLEAMTLSGKRLFDQLRERLSTLRARTDELENTELNRVHATRRLANIAQGTAAVLLLAVVAGSLWLLDRVLTRPVNRVLHDVTAVADGDYDRAIRSAGLREIAVLANAAETMRDNLRTSTTRLLEAERRDEQARMAADLNDRVIQRVFALGLGLTSAAQRRSPDLKPFVQETDGIIADLQKVVFNLNPRGADTGDDAMSLRSEVIEVLEDSVSALGFTPDLEFDGRTDARTISRAARKELVAVLRESLGNISRHARASAVTIRLAAVDGRLQLTVRDNGIGVIADDSPEDVFRDIHRRAEELGGYATIRNAGENGGTVIEWTVPLGQ